MQMVQVQLIQPILALVVWSLIMWAWMLTTRVKAIINMKMRLDPSAVRGEQMSLLPAQVRWKADNYNHLMEQPILFYVVTLSLILLGVTSEFALYTAWSYVFLRVVHSLVQALNNKIERRFAVFVLSNVPLIILTVIAINKAFGLS